MNTKDILKLANQVSDSLNASEKYNSIEIKNKIASALKSYPNDYTLKSLYSVLDKRKELLISKAELTNLYNTFYSRNNKFAEFFDKNIEQLKVKTAEKYDRTFENSKKDIYKEAVNNIVDPILENALSGMFDKKSNFYSKASANNSLSVTKSKLNLIDLNPKLDVVNGNENFILINAQFETPKGFTNILIPVETIKSTAMYPNMFIGLNGSNDFTKSNVEEYVISNAGNKLAIDTNKILVSLAEAKFGKTTISSVKIAATQVKAKQEDSNNMFTNFISTSPDKFYKQAAVNKIATEYDQYVDNMVSKSGNAIDKFGSNNVELGKNLISYKLNGLGFNNAQIAVNSNTDKQVVYSVKIANSSFNVPVEFSNNKPNEPKYIVANGGLSKFTREGVNSTGFDFKASAVASPMYGLKPSELILRIEAAISENNPSMAEDALNILMQTGDVKAYKNAFAMYKNSLGLNKTASVAEQVSTCSHIVKSANSIHGICSHTGLPVHKVTQDKFGHCVSKDKKVSYEQTSGGAYFSNSKVFL